MFGPGHLRGFWGPFETFFPEQESNVPADFGRGQLTLVLA